VTRSLLLSDMLGWAVVDTNGRKLGKLVELKVAPRGGYEVVALRYGPSTFLARVTAGESIDHSVERRLEQNERELDWSSVERVEERRIVVSAHAPARKPSVDE
jgi:sporulation protein YlmC with PRC-barrel domain